TGFTKRTKDNPKSITVANGFWLTPRVIASGTECSAAIPCFRSLIKLWACFVMQEVFQKLSAPSVAENNLPHAALLLFGTLSILKKYIAELLTFKPDLQIVFKVFWPMRGIS